MDEIFFVVTGKTTEVTVASRCSDKGCIALHHFTTVDDANVAKAVVDALNASNYARTISARLSA